MDLAWAVRAFELLLGWSLLLQTIEYLRLPALDRVSNWQIQRQELPKRPAWLTRLLDLLMQAGPYRGLLLLRLVLALLLMAGLLLAEVLGALGNPELGWRAGLWYVALQSVSSYFVSGWVKLLKPEWRSGAALPTFLDSGVYGPLPAGSMYRRPWVARSISWVFTVWEGCFPLALLDVRLAWLMCASAVVFHFLVFWYFGLNRFFWAWLATFPAILYCALR